VYGALTQIYFALVLYAYALHLRHGTYWMLPLSKSRRANAVHASTYQVVPHEGDEAALPDDEQPAASS